MTIIVEDGSIVAGANSYISQADLVDFAAARGVTLTGDTEQLLIKSMDYIEGYRAKFKGLKLTSDQPLQWPRSSVYVDNYLLANDVIPAELINAQAMAAIETDTNDLLASTGQAVKSEKVDVIEVVYQDGSESRNYFTKVQTYLAPVLKSSSSVYLGVMR